MGNAPLTLAYCWAHAWRKRHDIHQKDGSEIAAEGLRRIAEIYQNKAMIRGTPPDARFAVRQDQPGPLVADFRQSLTHQHSRLSAKSRLGETLACTHRQADRRWFQRPSMPTTFTFAPSRRKFSTAISRACTEHMSPRCALLTSMITRSGAS